MYYVLWIPEFLNFRIPEVLNSWSSECLNFWMPAEVLNSWSSKCLTERSDLINSFWVDWSCNHFEIEIQQNLKLKPSEWRFGKSGSIHVKPKIETHYEIILKLKFWKKWNWGPSWWRSVLQDLALNQFVPICMLNLKLKLEIDFDLNLKLKPPWRPHPYPHICHAAWCVNFHHVLNILNFGHVKRNSLQILPRALKSPDACAANQHVANLQQGDSHALFWTWGSIMGTEQSDQKQISLGTCATSHIWRSQIGPVRNTWVWVEVNSRKWNGIHMSVTSGRCKCTLHEWHFSFVCKCWNECIKVTESHVFFQMSNRFVWEMWTSAQCLCCELPCPSHSGGWHRAAG